MRTLLLWSFCLNALAGIAMYIAKLMNSPHQPFDLHLSSVVTASTWLALNIWTAHRAWTGKGATSALLMGTAPLVIFGGGALLIPLISPKATFQPSVAQFVSLLALAVTQLLCASLGVIYFWKMGADKGTRSAKR